jgi:uncharacterized protein (TIGR02001 family)
MKQISTLLLSSALAYYATASYANPGNSNTTIKNIKPIPTVGIQDPAVDPNAATVESAQQSPLTGNFDITTNYVFRGISNSNNNPAFQGGLTYTFLTTGIYLNVWGSNVDFVDPQGFQATVEADTIIGIANNINDDWSYNVNFNRYNYPKASAANYNEVIAALTYKIFTLTVADSLNVYGVHENGLYYNGLINVPLPQKYVHFSDLSAEASYGHYSLPRSAGLLSYNDYMIGLDKGFGMYDLLLQYTNTNHRSDSSGLDTSTLIATLTVNF